MSLNAVKYGEQSQNVLENQNARIPAQTPLPPTDIANDFKDIYIQYSKEGEVGGVNISVGGVESILNGVFLADNTSQTVTQISTKICNYWESFITPGMPVVLDVVTSVSVTASAQINPLKNAINSYITDENADGWIGFYQTIQPIIKTIPFIVVETNVSTGATQTFTRFLS